MQMQVTHLLLLLQNDDRLFLRMTETVRRRIDHDERRISAFPLC
jgi:hypothetical protein